MRCAACGTGCQPDLVMRSGDGRHGVCMQRCSACLTSALECVSAMNNSSCISRNRERECSFLDLLYL